VKREPTTISNLKSPVTSSRGQSRGFPEIPLSEMLPASQTNTRTVSLILIKDGRKMALIGNQFVKEGDVVGAGRIVRIDKARVLMTEGGVRTWLTLATESVTVDRRDGRTLNPLVSDQKKILPSGQDPGKPISAEQPKITR
jgi:hypothetical protein